MRASMKLVLLGPFVKHMFARWFCDRRGLFSGCARARGQAVETPPPNKKPFGGHVFHIWRCALVR